MTTSNDPVPAAVATQARVPLRLSMVARPGKDVLDGGWWPQSRELAVELADLVDHFPPRHGRIVRALFSPPDWDPAPRQVRVAAGLVKVGSFPRDDTHVMHLKTSDRTVLHVLVVPPHLTGRQGAEALLAAASPGNRHSAGDLLEEATDQPETDPEDLWTDEGGAWWGPDSGPPSTRDGG